MKFGCTLNYELKYTFLSCLCHGFGQNKVESHKHRAVSSLSSWFLLSLVNLEDLPFYGKVSCSYEAGLSSDPCLPPFSPSCSEPIAYNRGL